jgi:hypothetical protein
MNLHDQHKTRAVIARSVSELQQGIFEDGMCAMRLALAMC